MSALSEKNRNLLTRVLAAFVALPVVIFLVAKGGYWMGGLVGVAAAICAYEYYFITHQGITPVAAAGILIAGVMPLYPVYWPPSRAAEMAFWTIGLFFIISWTYHLLRGPLAEAPTRSAHQITGLLYASGGMTALAALRVARAGMNWVLCALLITWANDTFAYFAGRFFGKHKLYPQVSPNKTWEGFAGGMVGAVVCLLVARATFFPQLTTLDAVVVGVLGSIFGPIGDLCESMFKRAYNVKDSGSVLPGHGGLLDRVDALIFNAPVVYLYATLVRPMLG